MVDYCFVSVGLGSVGLVPFVVVAAAVWHCFGFGDFWFGGFWFSGYWFGVFQFGGFLLVAFVFGCNGWWC